MDPLSHESRYRGDEAIRKLAAARVCLCGAGAVGSTLADALARQGVKTLRVIDRDRVEPHNTSTQIYTTEDAGALKTDALKEHLFLATGTEIEGVAKELTPANARKLLKDVDLVIDGFDNSASRRAVTEACLAEGWACLHVGLNADYGEVRWNERYLVPGDAGADVCDYPLARNLVQLVTAVASEVVVRYLLTGAREDYSVTLKDLKVNHEDLS
jgi:molybdopterin/thiamine biosynthesis adenylyltransferase